MSLLALRTSVVDTLKTELPAVKNIDTHAGRFDMAELKRLAVAAPAIRVACLGVVRIEEEVQGEVEATVRMGAFIAGRDTPGVKRDAAALAIVDTLLQKLPGNTWGRDDTDEPKNKRADNLFSAELDKLGVALWAVSWEQKTTLTGIDEATLDVFETFDAELNIGETPDTEKSEVQITGLDD